MFTKSYIRWLLHLLLLIFAVLLFLSTDESLAQQQSGGTLLVQVGGLRNEKGIVRVYLWDRDDRYPKKFGRAKVHRSGTISKGRAVVSFKNLPHGTWAAFAFHDEDNNGEILSNWIGMPKEGVGASNNARGRMGPPSFEDASFQHLGNSKTISITLRYL